MGYEYNQLGEVCESSKQAKGRKFVWTSTTVLDSQCVCMNNKERARMRAWSWNIHEGRILEHVGVILENFGVEY
jgi:hypothetical protein